jgi:hypothetical protein
MPEDKQHKPHPQPLFPHTCHCRTCSGNPSLYGRNVNACAGHTPVTPSALNYGLRQQQYQNTVITGFVPVIHRCASEMSTRAQGARLQHRHRRTMDCRNKSGNDKLGKWEYKKGRSFLRPPCYFPFGFRSGACVNTDAATVRTGAGVFGLFKSLAAMDATLAEVLSFFVIIVFLS